LVDAVIDVGCVDVVWFWGTVIRRVPVDLLADFVEAVQLVENVEGYGVITFVVDGRGSVVELARFGGGDLRDAVCMRGEREYGLDVEGTYGR
jgi:hypothetical protein